MLNDKTKLLIVSTDTLHSEHNSFDSEPWILTLIEFTKKVLAQDRVRLIGVCFGHQIIGRAMGVKVGRSDKGWEVAVCDVDLTSKGKELFGLDTLVSAAYHSTGHPMLTLSQHIHQMHRDIVYEFPRSVERLGSSPLCDVQGMYIKNHLITVQGHPEFNETIETEILTRRHGQGIFKDDAFDEAMKRVSKPHDGVIVAATFLQFVLVE